MGLFSNKLEFRTIEFLKTGKAFDYPKRLPIPRIGEWVQFDGNFGWVVSVKHMISGSVSEVRICCRDND